MACPDELLELFDRFEQVAPSATQRASQADEDAETRSDGAGFEFLVMSAAEVHSLGDFLLRQAGGFPQTGEIAAKSEEMGLCE